MYRCFAEAPETPTTIAAVAVNAAIVHIERIRIMIPIRYRGGRSYRLAAIQQGGMIAQALAQARAGAG